MLLTDDPTLPTEITEQEYLFYLLKYPFLHSQFAKRFMIGSGFWLEQYSLDADFEVSFLQNVAWANNEVKLSDDELIVLAGYARTSILKLIEIKDMLVTADGRT